MNARQQLLVHTLCVCVRALTFTQAMRLLGIPDEANFRRFVRGLAVRGLVNVLSAWAKPVPTAIANGPLFAADGVTNSILPDVGRILELARDRWAPFAAERTRCVVGTKKAGLLYGVSRSGWLSKPLQLSHDLAASEVLLVLIAKGGVKPEQWCGEDTETTRVGSKVVDAVVTTERGSDTETRRTLVEIIGANYTPEKILSIHLECTARGLAYELW